MLKKLCSLDIGLRGIDVDLKKLFLKEFLVVSRDLRQAAKGEEQSRDLRNTIVTRTEDILKGATVACITWG